MSLPVCLLPAERCSRGVCRQFLGTSFTAEDEDIIGADNDYKALEVALRNKINQIEQTHSGYDKSTDMTLTKSTTILMNL